MKPRAVCHFFYEPLTGGSNNRTVSTEIRKFSFEMGGFMKAGSLKSK
jgi:hypothetical protein